MADEKVAAKPKSSKKGLVIWILLAVFALGAGASVPWLIGGLPHDAHPVKKSEPAKHKQVAIPFDNVVVNIGDERVNRYLRVKLMVAVEEADVRDATELLTKQKPFLKNWLIEYLSGQPSHESDRTARVNRIRREIRDRFNAMLYPNFEEKIVDILFDEFHMQ